MKKLIVGTRGSALALHQTNHIVEALKTHNPDIEFEVRIIRTKGDAILSVPLAKIGDKGLFVKEIEAALLAGEIDFAVHSAKDLPGEIPAGLCITVPERVDAHDVLITNGPGLAELPRGARVGTSSPRRRAQILHARPDLIVEDVRGNLDTRLKKLSAREFDAIVLAYAGLARMGWTERITEVLPIEICVPAVGQGALAIEARAEDAAVIAVLRAIEYSPSLAEVTAERAAMYAIGGGCQVPFGAHADISSDIIRMHGVLADPDGKRLVRKEIEGSVSEAEKLGKSLASALAEKMHQYKTEAG